MRNNEDFKRAADVVVIGGGVTGLAAARELARRGLRVTVLERGQAGAEASWAAGGMLAPQCEADARDEFFDLLCASRDLYPDYAEALREETGIDIELDRTGTLYLALTGEDAEEVGRRYEWQLREGLSIERLTTAEALSLEPSVSPRVQTALRFPRDWQVENRRLVAALASSIENYGARLMTQTEVLGVRVVGGSVQGVETSRGFMSAGAVVLAAGAWASRVPILEGDDVPMTKERMQVSEHPRIEPVRGQMLCFEQDGAILRAFAHVVYSPRGYVVPRRDGRLLAGSTTEFTGFDKRTTAEGRDEVTAHALEIAPALAKLPHADSWAGLRPRAADEKPVLGASINVRNLFYATGAYRNGILLAPLTGEVLAALLTGDDTRAAVVAPSLIKAFSPKRLQRAVANSHGV